MLFTKSSVGNFRNISPIPSNYSETIDKGIYKLTVYHMPWGPDIKLRKLDKQNYISFNTGVFGEISNYIDTFYTTKSKEMHAELGMRYKSGIILYGPPGTGKSGLAYIAGKKAVENLEAIVLYVNNWNDAITFSNCYLNKETKPIIFIQEEIDQQIKKEGVSKNFLTYLDSPESPDNMMYIATTNHVNELPATLTSRPSRFAMVRHIDKVPNELISEYVNNIVSEQLAQKYNINRAELIEKLSNSDIRIDSIKAVIQAHVILGKSIDDSIKILLSNELIEEEKNSKTIAIKTESL